MNCTVALNAFRLQVFRRRQSWVVENPIYTSRRRRHATKQLCRVGAGGGIRGVSSSKRRRSAANAGNATLTADVGGWTLTSLLYSRTRGTNSVYKKLCRRTARCAVSVEISSTIGTSCSTNPEQTNVIELWSCSWPTFSSRRHDASTVAGVVSKFHHRRRVLLTTPSTCSGDFFSNPEFGAMLQTEVTLFLRYPNFLKTRYGIGGRKPRIG